MMLFHNIHADFLPLLTHSVSQAVVVGIYESSTSSHLLSLMVYLGNSHGWVVVISHGS